ncbi:MAG: glycosyltransferase family 4 protein [Actinobacteria bacterium]|nr:glycosyltransferase family 4 protein [Actinomycetota bacterium]
MSRLEMLRPGNARWAAEKSLEAWRDGGVRGLVIKAVDFMEKRRVRAEATPPLPISPGVYRGAVVMLADVEPPQCWHYRVQQKREAFGAKAIPFVVVRPTSSAEVLSAVQLASLLIIYRQPMSMLLQDVIVEARRLRIPVVYEADDIVYRQDLVAANPNLATLPADLRKAVIAGAADYAEALAVCDGVISSTQPLADDMAAHLGSATGAARVGSAVIENGIDASMWSISRGIDHDLASGKIPRGKDGRVVIGYGSGSRAHDADLAVAAPALSRILAEHPNVQLRLFGPVAPPPTLIRFADRIERVPILPQGEYLWEFAHADIALAPLLDVEFNHFKSQVKYAEAGLVRLPLVASPTVYGNYIDDGRTGFIADGQAQWHEVLTRLVTDAELRARVGQAARADVARWDVAGPIADQAAAMLSAFGVKVAN